MSQVLAKGLHLTQMLPPRDYVKITERISTKRGGSLSYGPQRNPLNIGADKEHVSAIFQEIMYGY